MGAIRSFPENEVKTISAKKEELYFINVSLCGWQFYMEDYSFNDIEGKRNLFAIFDGHNGPEVAEFCQAKLPELYHKSDLINMGQTLIGMENLVYELENLVFHSDCEINEIRLKNGLPSLNKDEKSRSGCSVILVSINDEEIIIGNVGLCRCYVTYREDRSKAILYSGNHIPSNKEEEARISRNGGYIYNSKVNGTYPFTRSIGDYYLKKKGHKPEGKTANEGLITCEPSFFSLRKEDISSILFGSSGAWEKPEEMEKAFPLLSKNIQKDEEELENLLGRMIAVEPCQERLGFQNMTITYICLEQ